MGKPVADLIVKKVKHAVASDSLGELSVADMEAVLASLSQLSTKLENAERQQRKGDAACLIVEELAAQIPLPFVIQATGTAGDMIAWFKGLARERDELRAKLAEARAALADFTALSGDITKTLLYKIHRDRDAIILADKLHQADSRARAVKEKK